jgi:hypothetical protein
VFTKRPLLDTVADQALYVTDASRKRAAQAAFQHRNTLIVGEPGSGKTTLLYQIRANADAGPTSSFVIIVDARIADGARDLVDLILLEAEQAGWIEVAERPTRDDPFGLIAQVRRLRDTKERDAIILVDDPDPKQAATLFGRLRDELWQLPVWFVVAVNSSAYETLSQPPADAFFDMVINLEPLDPDAALELLRRRKHNGELPEQIRSPARPLQPRAILLDAEAGPIGARQDGELQQRLMTIAEEETGRSGVMLLAEIWGRGAVSASDDGLQRTLGVSRVRLTQLLGELERARVLTSFRETPPGGPGRPRTMYDINRAA